MQSILFAGPVARFDPKLGGPQTILELGEALRRRGHRVAYFSQADADGMPFVEALFAFLRKRPELRIVDVMDAAEIREIPPDLRDRLWVARVTLLEFHFEHILFPRHRPGIWGKAIDWTWGWIKDRREAARQRERRKRLSAFYHTADLIAVANPRDASRLVEHGHPKEKIVVQRYAVAEERQASLLGARAQYRESPLLVFLGTFDPRKGCHDLVNLLDRLCDEIPTVTLRLLGTRGLCPDEAAVMRYFPKYLQQRIEVIPQFDPAELPRWLEGARLGVFPSYVESFGLAVVEQMLAGVPVIAYDAPGPDGILPPEWLCPTGDVDQLWEMVRSGLQWSEEEWIRASALARKAAIPYTWDEPAEVMESAYANAMKTLSK